MPYEKDPGKLVDEIIRYFVQHPDMVDDLEGIARWRLLSARIESAVEITQAALDSLVDQGFLLRIDKGSHSFYRMNPNPPADRKPAPQANAPPGSGTRDTLRKENRTVAIQIRNQARHLLLVPLSSRTTLHLAPGQTSAPLEEAEISQNQKVAKMAKAGMISLIRTSGKASPA